MTKDEDDWLSDFLEAVQASARQGQTAAEKDYATRLKLLSPRIDRARACDTDEEMAKRLAASEALAGQKKFDAAADALDEAFVLAASLLSAAAATAAAAVVESVPDALEPSLEPLAGPVGELTAEVPSETEQTNLESIPEEPPPVEEAPAEEPIEIVPAEPEVAVAEESAAPADETPAVEPENAEANLDAMLDDLSPAEEVPPGEPVEVVAAETEAVVVEEPIEAGGAAAVEPENAEANLDAMLDDLSPAEGAPPEEPVEVVAAETEAVAVEEPIEAGGSSAVESESAESDLDAMLDDLSPAEKTPPAEETSATLGHDATFSMGAGSVEAEASIDLDAFGEEAAAETTASTEEAPGEESASSKAADKSKGKSRS